MKTIKTGYDWLDRLLPEGLPIPSSTLISGPGGTGKPLVEFSLVAAWLKNGGNAIAIPLQYPTMEFLSNSMFKLYKINLLDFKGQISYIQFDPTINKPELLSDNIIKSNLLSPELWDHSIAEANKLIDKKDGPVIVFGSALNLLLFSPTYKNVILKKIEEILVRDKTKSYLFSVSNNVLAEEIAIWENAADNLMFTRMENSKQLFLRVARMKEVKFAEEEIAVPISKEILREIKVIADKTRKRTIPVISKI